jgi:hypothetical protein
MILAILFAGAVHAATVTDSWVGTKIDPFPAGTQFLAGASVYVHLILDLKAPGRPVVKWYRNGRIMKSITLAGTRKTAYSTVSIKAQPGNWTVVITDARKGWRRSHHFRVS